MLINSNVGGIFICWGWIVCFGYNIELVYLGFVGGFLKDYSGVVVEFICFLWDLDFIIKFFLSYVFM